LAAEGGKNRRNKKDGMAHAIYRDELQWPFWQVNTAIELKMKPHDAVTRA
jgi:hypothetical protein